MLPDGMASQPAKFGSTALLSNRVGSRRGSSELLTRPKCVSVIRGPARLTEGASGLACQASDRAGRCAGWIGDSNMSLPMKRRRLALVVEGGGLRGAFSAGALAALDRLLPRRPDFIFATSAGAPSAAFMTTGQIDIAIRLWENRTHASHLVSPMHWLRGRPLMDVDKLVSHFRDPRALAVQHIDAAPTHVYLAVTNCRTARPDYVRLTSQNAFTLLTAAMALPIAYGRVIQCDGQYYVDGGITDSIPLEPALERDIEDITVVLTQPREYRKRHSKAAEWLLRWQYSPYPNLFEAFMQRAECYNRCLERIEELERQGRISVLRPTAPLPASRMTRDRARILKTIQLGRDAAREWLRHNPFARDEPANEGPVLEPALLG